MDIINFLYTGMPGFTEFLLSLYHGRMFYHEVEQSSAHSRILVLWHAGIRPQYDMMDLISLCSRVKAAINALDK